MTRSAKVFTQSCQAYHHPSQAALTREGSKMLFNSKASSHLLDLPIFAGPAVSSLAARLSSFGEVHFLSCVLLEDFKSGAAYSLVI